MSLRALWILRLPTPQSPQGDLVYYRTFPLVEQKARGAEGNKYVALPPPPQMSLLLLQECGWIDAGNKFVPERDSCQKKQQSPVFDIKTEEGNLWPVVVVEQAPFLIACLPLVEQGAYKRPPLLKIPAVTVGFAFACGLAEHLRCTTQIEVQSRLDNLQVYLNEAAPFGTPCHVNPDTVSARLLNAKYSVPQSQKVPAWKPALHKGKSTINLVITEYIKASQWGQAEALDVWAVYGTVTCQAELEGAMPDITLNLSHLSQPSTLPLDSLLTHPCVQSADAATLPPQETPGTDARPVPRRVRFTPPLEAFPLCHYTVSQLSELPILGVFQMKWEKTSATINITLKLNDQVKNMFEYCELQVPTLERGLITSYDITPSQGIVTLSPDKKILAWNIGQKFPAKTLEVSVTGSLQLSETAATPDVLSDLDRFCVGQNSYCQLYFKISDFTHSGCYIDPKSIQVSSGAKYKLTTVREYLSTDYKIWNSLGDAPTA